MTEPPAITSGVVQLMIGETRARLEHAALVSHPGERGRARESILRDFLRRLCPLAFKLTTGFVFDVHGSVSRQQDLLIVRESYHPRFTVGEVEYHPIEAVVAAIEVKSSFEQSQRLVDSLDCLETVKSLDRSAEGTNRLVVGHISPGAFDGSNHNHQVFTAVVGLTGVGPETAIRVFGDWNMGHPREEWSNLVASVSSYYLTYLGTSPHPATNQMVGSSLGAFPISQDDPLLELAKQLLSFLRVAPIIDFQPERYLGRNEVLHTSIVYPLSRSS